MVDKVPDGFRFPTMGPCEATTAVYNDICGTRGEHYHDLGYFGAGGSVSVIEYEQPHDYGNMPDVSGIRANSIANGSLTPPGWSYTYGEHYTVTAEIVYGSVPESDLYIGNMIVLQDTMDMAEAFNCYVPVARIFSVSLGFSQDSSSASQPTRSDLSYQAFAAYVDWIVRVGDPEIGAPLVVLPAGNDDVYNTNRMPANFSLNALIVGAAEPGSGWGNLPESRSNYVMNPISIGENIAYPVLPGVLGGSDFFAEREFPDVVAPASATSFSTPLVAGVGTMMSGALYGDQVNAEGYRATMGLDHAGSG